jgi:hypothetical protein
MKIQLRMFVVVAMASSLAFGVTTVASAGGHGGHGGGGTTACVPGTPRVSIDNSWAWASPGSWGMPGQELRYAVNVFNADVGCGSSSFAVTLTAPEGVSVSIPSSTINVGSASSAYVWAYVTSPMTATDGDYPLSATVDRVGSSSALTAAAATSVYKVYSTDTAAPGMYWENPSDGGAISGRSTYVGFASSDDHAVKNLEVAIDGARVASGQCDNISPDCQLSYKWTLRKVSGQHTATFTATDWMGNVTSQTVTFTVN